MAQQEAKNHQGNAEAETQLTTEQAVRWGQALDDLMQEVKEGLDP